MKKSSLTVVFSVVLALALSLGVLAPALAAGHELVCNGDFAGDFTSCPDPVKVWTSIGWFYDAVNEYASSLGGLADNTLTQCIPVTLPPGGGAGTTYSLNLGFSFDMFDTNTVDVDFFDGNSACTGLPTFGETLLLADGSNSFSGINGTGHEKSVRLIFHCSEGNMCDVDDVSLQGEDPTAVSLTSFHGSSAWLLPGAMAAVALAALAGGFALLRKQD